MKDKLAAACSALHMQEETRTRCEIEEPPSGPSENGNSDERCRERATVFQREGYENECYKGNAEQQNTENKCDDWTFSGRSVPKVDTLDLLTRNKDQTAHPIHLRRAFV